jgi:hypothetical protein
MHVVAIGRFCIWLLTIVAAPGEVKGQALCCDGSHARVRDKDSERISISRGDRAVEALASALASVGNPNQSGSTEAIAAAKRWLVALKNRDLTHLAPETAFPFSLRSTLKAVVMCEGIAPDARRLDAMVDCLSQHHGLLFRELANAGEFDFKVVGSALELPAALRRLVGKVGNNEQLLMLGINGDGITYELVLIRSSAAGARGIKAFLLNAEIESG